MHKVHRDYKYAEQRRDGLLLLRGIQECRRRSVQQLKYREEEWCIECIWCTEQKRQKHRKRKACVQQDSETLKEG
jgi:hypothetical protein